MIDQQETEKEYVYFMESIETGFVKVGKSKYPDDRKRVLERVYGKLNILFYYEGDLAEERFVQERLKEMGAWLEPYEKDKRQGYSEWFKLYSYQIIDIINYLKKRGRYLFYDN